MKYLLILFTMLSSCGVATTVVYDSAVSPEITEAEIQTAIASGKMLNVTFTHDPNKLTTLAGKLQKNDSGYYFMPRRKAALGNNGDRIHLERKQIKKIEIIQKDGLRESETSTLLIVIGLVALVAATIAVTIPLSPGS